MYPDPNQQHQPLFQPTPIWADSCWPTAQETASLALDFLLIAGGLILACVIAVGAVVLITQITVSKAVRRNTTTQEPTILQPTRTGP